MMFTNKRNAFTLSEVMVTIALVGVLATLTLTNMGASVQKRAKLAEFKTAYAKLNTTLRAIMQDSGKIYTCYAKPNSKDKSDYGLSIESDTDAKSIGCEEFENVFVRALGTTRFCQGNPITGGCIPEDYPIATGCFTSYDSSNAYVLDNSMIIFTDGDNSMQLFAIDVNGRKGPNKWGEDIFPFSLKYTETVKVNGNTFVKDVGILPPDENSCTYAKNTNSTTRTLYREYITGK